MNNAPVSSAFYRTLTVGLALFSALLLSACANQMRVQGQGPIVEQRYELNGIDRVHFSGRGEVRILPSDESVLVVSAARNVQSALDIDINDERLKAGPQRHVYFSSDSRPVYTLYVNDLERLSVSGAMSIMADELRGEELTLSVSGRAEVDMNVEATALNIHCSGSADITARGLVDQLEIHTSGSVKLEGGDLLARHVDIATSGSSRVTIWAEESLNIRSSGSTRVRYRGQPLVSQSVSGSSSVEALDDE
ncbi:head GIN domain-containing protein [Saccharospirillum sp. HFRX-1]|uniref:head GIN domain-containing protein n=1 Tax=unclassified Saccharospirillum TaxID=2633430 RepID=UPI0037150C0F